MMAPQQRVFTDPITGLQTRNFRFKTGRPSVHRPVNIPCAFRRYSTIPAISSPFHPIDIMPDMY